VQDSQHTPCSALPTPDSHAQAWAAVYRTSATVTYQRGRLFTVLVQLSSFWLSRLNTLHPLTLSVLLPTHFLRQDGWQGPAWWPHLQQTAILNHGQHCRAGPSKHNCGVIRGDQLAAAVSRPAVPSPAALPQLQSTNLWQLNCRVPAGTANSTHTLLWPAAAGWTNRATHDCGDPPA
jgi:hypothetical protein